MKTKKLSQRSFAVFLTTILLLVAVPASVVFAATSGPNYPGTASGSGWGTPANIGADDTSYATYTIASSGTSTPINGSNYGFSIPSGSTIDGITVVISRASSAGTSLEDANIQMLKAGATTGINKAVGTDWTTSQVLATYGSATDLWGTTWTADDVNNTGFGVTLSAFNKHGSLAITALVDYMSITVNYTLPGTTTAVNCVANPITFGGNTTCTATVTRSAGTDTPAGSVSWATDGSGSFATSPCTLAGAGASATCSVTYTPSSVGDGTHLVTATYAGNTNFSGSNGSQTVTVNKATPTVSVTNSPVTYNGSQQAAAVSGSVAGVVSNIKYNGSSTIPTDAGTYAVTADFSPTDTTNYNSLADASAGDFVIEKATPTISVTNSPVTYNGAAQAATVTGSVAGVVSNVQYDGSLTEPTDAGTYVVTADFTPTDTTNYNSLISDGAGNFVINKATPTVSVTNSPVTYNGSAQAATVLGSVAGVVSDVQYDGSATEPTNVGTYAVTANFTPTDINNYNSLTDASAGNFVINNEATAPTVSSSVRAGTNPTNTTTVNFTVTFSESVTGVDMTDFNLTTSGVTGATITNVTGSGRTHTVTVHTGSGNGTIRLDVVDDDSILDGSNNPLGGIGAANGDFTSGEVYTILKNVPYANVQVRIAGNNVGTHNIAQKYNLKTSYSGINNGPVRVTSTLPLVASERVAYSPDGGTTWTSYSELMGLPVNQLSSSYTFPWYNNADLNTQLRFGNVGTVSSQVKVFIGGDLQSTHTLIPNQSKRISYDGLDDGPVVIQSSGNVPIIASMRVAYSDGSAVTSFSEMMGLPSNKLTNSYTFPWYNNADLDSQLRFGNVGTVSTQVKVFIGGDLQSTHTLLPNQSRRISYDGLDDGPVVIQSSGNVPIIASMRVLYNDGTAVTSFSEMMGLPTNALSSRYAFPVYDNVQHDSQLRFGNVGTVNTQVKVFINGVLKSTHNLAPNQSRRVSYLNLDAGPVVIQSSGNVPIIASKRVLYNDGTAVTSFSEMMGLPQSQWTTTYLFPWYNNLDLDTQLRFGVP